MQAIIALIFWTICLVLPTKVTVNEPVIIPPMPQHSPLIIEEQEWDDYNRDAYEEYADEFTALFNSYTTKRAKNGALMIRRGNSGSYKFAKKG
jgi:hypothetical protein